MKSEKTTGAERIRSSRERHNILKKAEFKTIEILCKIMPDWVTPDMLTALGLLGSFIIAAGLIMAIDNPYFLLLSIVGFAIQWFGDSLDGRLAYYRNTPRKWYGWALDINADWISICVIGLGFYFYFPAYKIVSFLFVVAYGGSMIVALLRYKINDKYIIDTMALGPTELRIIISVFMLFEIFFEGALLGLGVIGSGLLMLFNLIESYRVLKAGDIRDAREKAEKRRRTRLA